LLSFVQGFQLAVRGTSISIAIVAVVALLVGGVVHDAITTGFDEAVSRAAIPVLTVSVVALLP
jgi:hypothetical protein